MGASLSEYRLPLGGPPLGARASPHSVRDPETRARRTAENDSNPAFFLYSIYYSSSVGPEI